MFDPAFTPKYLINRWVRQQSGYVLNFGSGSRFLGEHVINLDIEDSAHVHIVNKSSRVPFKDNSIDAVLLEYVLEHVENYHELLQDVMRVLKPGGSILITVPFRQNYHACPQDYWRFTHEGLEALLLQLGTHQIRVEVYGGPASAWIDATKEFLATILSCGSVLAYAFWSQILIVPFIPLRYLDVVLRRLPVARYTAFSFQVTAQKPGVLQRDEHRQSIEDKLQQALWIPEGYEARERRGGVWIENRPGASTTSRFAGRGV